MVVFLTFAKILIRRVLFDPFFSLHIYGLTLLVWKEKGRQKARADYPKISYWEVQINPITASCDKCWVTDMLVTTRHRNRQQQLPHGQSERHEMLSINSHVLVFNTRITTHNTCGSHIPRILHLILFIKLLIDYI